MWGSVGVGQWVGWLCRVVCGVCQAAGVMGAGNGQGKRVWEGRASQGRVGKNTEGGWQAGRQQQAQDHSRQSDPPSMPMM